jgi:hypothetical protein
LLLPGGVQVGRTDEAIQFARRLVGKQHSDGSVEGAKTSITCSGGSALTIEATSVAVLAWLHDDQFALQVNRAMEWLVGITLDPLAGCVAPCSL